jgi:pSer/pThr/pTyr-binding forkhead associated (FHA) protein
LSIGRAPDCDVFLNDVTVSRRHARMLKSEAGVTIIDDDSLNGTYVNDTCVSTAVLHDGDHVRIGRFQMVFFSGEGS